MIVKYGSIIFLCLISVVFVGVLIVKNNVSATTTIPASASASKATTIDLMTAKFGVEPTDQNDIQIDNQDSSTSVVIYRSDLSKDKAVFDVTIKDPTHDLTSFDYNKNLVLTDTNVAPLTHDTIYLIKGSSGELNLRFTAQKYPGDHFHFLIENLGSIHDRVLHFYRRI